MKKLHFDRGYYQCGDDVLGWLNSLDSSGMEVKDLRSAIWHFILGAQPNDPSRYSNEEKD
jgi:hypothetical protein